MREHINDFVCFVMENKPIIVSLEGCNEDVSKKILCFLDGFIFASNARIVTLDEKNLYLILPEGMGIEE